MSALDPRSFLIGILIGVIVGLLGETIMKALKALWIKIGGFVGLLIAGVIILGILFVDSVKCLERCEFAGLYFGPAFPTPTGSPAPTPTPTPRVVYVQVTAVPPGEGCPVVEGQGLTCRTLP